MSQFRHAFAKLVPSWLSTDEGQLALHSLWTLADWARERVRLGLYARMPDYAPPDALSAIGRDRLIVRGIDESDDSYAVRLKRWLDDHLVRGTPWGMLDQIHAFLQADCVLRTVDRRGNWFTREADGTRTVNRAVANWTWDGTAASSWSRFWVIIYPVDSAPWEDIAAWGGWSETGTHTPEQVSAIRSIVRQWKPAGTVCEWIICAFDPLSFDPGFPAGFAGMPDDQWGGFGVNVGTAWEPIRLDTARYWRGVDGT